MRVVFARVRQTVIVGVAVVSLSGCSWAMVRYDAAHTGYNPFERTIAVDNVANLHEVWSATTGDQIWSSPAVFGGVVYVGSNDNRLYAYGASGTTDCAGSPKVCTPLWRSAVLGGDVQSSPAVDSAHVFVTSVGNNLVALDRSGGTNCSGTPRTCAPQWSYQVPSDDYSSPTVVGPLVYFNDGSFNDFLFAIDTDTGKAAWSASEEVPDSTILRSSPAVANGIVFTQFPDAFFSPGPGLYAYDAAGTRNCSGSPKSCAPLWSAPVAALSQESSPAVANGVVYTTGARLDAFDAAGNTGCSGRPKVCQPLWTAANAHGSPAVAKGMVYVLDNGLEAFDAAGNTRCSGTPKVCQPLWTTAPFGSTGLSDPVVANGVVYIGSSTGLHAFNAQTGAPLWSSPPGDYRNSSPAVVDGMVFIGGLDHQLHAFALQ